ncbi:MAG: hypothetical protein L3J73_04740, partial [Thermoplasmata archaeon]|nr:hypothetical protein [Thermoplasmata archaeon]
PSPPPAVVDVALVVNVSAGARPINASFWGINLGLNVGASTTLANAVAQSPVHIVRFPGGAAGDEFNYTVGTVTNDSGVARPATENLSEFVTWCRAINCTPILELPGEIDDASTAAYYVTYTEQTFGLRPMAWEVGNEPALWTHFGTAWSHWTVGQQLTPSPSQYARVVHDYIAAIHRVDPAAPILGLPGVGTGAFGETTWINATVALNGPNLTGVGIHCYPAGPGPGSSGNISQFLVNASGPRSIGARLGADRAAVAAALPSRPGLPLYVTELGTGLAAGSFSPFLYSFPSVPFIASELIAALSYDVTSVELTQVQTPHGGAWMDGNGTVHPLLSLYTQLLPELGPSVIPVNISPGLAGLSAIVTTSGGSGPVELFAVNANASLSARIDLSASGLGLNGTAMRWTWNSSTDSPVAVDLTQAPPTWTIPPDSVLLLRLSGGLVPAVASPAADEPSILPIAPTMSTAVSVARWVR